jgi:hypothetical protein
MKGWIQPTLLSFWMDDDGWMCVVCQAASQPIKTLMPLRAGRTWTGFEHTLDLIEMARDLCTRLNE